MYCCYYFLKGGAHGNVVLDDGEGLNTVHDEQYTWIDFSVQAGNSSGKSYNSTLSSFIRHDGYEDARQMSLGGVTVYGLPSRVATVFVQGQSVDSFSYDSKNKSLQVFGLFLPMDKPFQVSWQV